MVSLQRCISMCSFTETTTLFLFLLLCRDVAEKNDKPSAYLMTVGGHVAKSVDPLASLAKQLGGSKRNALLKWCQNHTATYTVCVVFTIASVATVATYMCCCFIMVILVVQKSQL